MMSVLTPDVRWRNTVALVRGQWRVGVCCASATLSGVHNALLEKKIASALEFPSERGKYNGNADSHD